MSKPKEASVQELPELTPLELHRVVRMPEAERLSGLSEDSLKRNHSNKIIRLGPRAIGMRVGDALHLNKVRTD
jgi:hypothetical protein